MTQREFFENIINGTIGTEEIEHAKAEIEKLNVRNAKRAERPSKKAVENEPIKANIVDFLSGKDFTVASEIATGLELKVQKVSALCRQLVTDGVLVATDIKVKGKGNQKGYKVA